ncbi:MAG: class I adenylate-forming enzyme family protein [Promethearchaeota archaeon]
MKIPKLEYIWQYVSYWAEINPNFPFIKYKWKKYNAKQFKETIDHLAEAFLSLGVNKGDSIITILPMIMEYPLIYLAANSMGAMCVPMDVRFRSADYRRFIPHIAPKLVFLIGKARGYNISNTIQELSLEFNPMIKYFMIGKDEFGTQFEELLKNEYNLTNELLERRKKLNPNEGALIIFTGGSTGIPKAAMLTHRNIAHASFLEASYIQDKGVPLGLKPRFKMINNFPPSHVGGSVEIMGTIIAAGCEIVLQEQWNPYNVLRATRKWKLQLIGGVPTMYAIMLSLPDLDDFDLSSLILAILSGEKVNIDLLTGIRDRVCPNILNAYGSTESGPEVTFTEIGDSIEELANGYIGNLLPEQEIKIVDENDNELPPGEIGEMLFRGTLTIPQYYKMPEENKVAFTEDGWCRSGDLGYITIDGRIYIKGRKKFIIRVGSYTVLPSEIESVVIEHPKVAMVAAVGIPDKIYNEVVWITVVPESGEVIDENEIYELCKKELADFKVPKRIIIKKELPITRLAKVDRPALRKQLINDFNIS